MIPKLINFLENFISSTLLACDMHVRKAGTEDYEPIIKLTKEFFTIHNIFKKDGEKIVSYIENESRKNTLLVCDDNAEITGVTFLISDNNMGEPHRKWKLKHFAYKTKEAGKYLLEGAEDFIKKISKTSKIEVTIAENEESLNFFKEQGYEEEGKLKNHYRLDETAYILGKLNI